VNNSDSRLAFNGYCAAPTWRPKTPWQFAHLPRSGERSFIVAHDRDQNVRTLYERRVGQRGAMMIPKQALYVFLAVGKLQLGEVWIALAADATTNFGDCDVPDLERSKSRSG
jgi:hypothetical protein